MGIRLRRLWFLPVSICWLTDLLVCCLIYTKTTEQFSTKLGWRTGHGPEYTPSTSRDRSRTFFSLSLLTQSDRELLDIYINVSGNNALILLKKLEYLGCWYLLVSTTSDCWALLEACTLLCAISYWYVKQEAGTWIYVKSLQCSSRAHRPILGYGMLQRLQVRDKVSSVNTHS